MFVRRMLAATCVVPLLLVAGCNADEPEPKMPTASPTSHSPTTATPTVDPLAIPAGAKEPTKAGAEVLVRHYFDMFNHLWATGDSAPVRKLYGERCDLCEIPVGVIELAQSKGHTYEGSEQILGLEVFMLSKVSGVRAAVGYVNVGQTAIVERGADGRVVNRFPADKTEKFEYYLAFQGGSWEITNAEVAK